MKGTNTLIVNDSQMKEIVQEWWDRHTYSNMGKVVNVEAEGFNFTIEIDAYEDEEKS